MAEPRMHQLSNGMLVSGPREPPKARSPTMASKAIPYTGGDIQKSGELGKMFDVQVLEPGSAAAPGISRPRSGSRPNSGNLPRSSPSSGSIPVPKRTSGSTPQIPPTGLITSGPLRSGGQQPEQPLTPSRRKKKAEYGAAVTEVKEKMFEFGMARAWVWLLALVLMIGLGAGVFVWVAVGRPEVLAGAAAVAGAVAVVTLWNSSMRNKEAERFFRSFPDTQIDPRNLPVGNFVKITGHVTCGHIPLEPSYGNASRCIFASTKLCTYRGWSGLLTERSKWKSMISEKHVADFYISDKTTGTRFLVRAGNGAKVTSFVNVANVLDINKEKQQQNAEIQSWLADHGLCDDKQVMRLKEGYIKEGDTASVLGILKRHGNLVIIDPPTGAVSTGCQWRLCFFPIFIEGIIIIGDDRPDEVVYQVSLGQAFREFYFTFGNQVTGSRTFNLSILDVSKLVLTP